MMLHTKYKAYRPCGFRQEDFQSFHLENLFFLPVRPKYATDQKHLNIFKEGHIRLISSKFGQNPASGEEGDVL